MKYPFITKVLLRKSVKRADYWFRGNESVHKYGLHLGFFSTTGHLGLKAYRAANFLRGDLRLNEYTNEVFVCPRDGRKIFESLGINTESRYEAVIRATQKAMKTLLSKENLNAPDARWLAAWQDNKQRAWLIVLLAQSVDCSHLARKIKRLPKKLFQKDENDELSITKIFRISFESEIGQVLKQKHQ